MLKVPHIAEWHPIIRPRFIESFLAASFPLRRIAGSQAMGYDKTMDAKTGLEGVLAEVAFVTGTDGSQLEQSLFTHHLV